MIKFPVNNSPLTFIFQPLINMAGHEGAGVQQHGDNHDIPNDLQVHK